MSVRIVRYLRRHHLGLLALFVALGGTSYAATRLPANSVGASQLKANSVTSSKVRNGTLTARDFAAASLPVGPAGPRGDTGPKGDTGPAGLSHAYTSSGPDGSFISNIGLDLATIHLSAGSYMLYADAVLQNITAARVAMSCGLGDPGLGVGSRAVDLLQVDLQPGASPDVARVPISLIGVINLAQSDTVGLECDSSGAPGSVNYFGADIGAIQVAAVN
jgi:hypothetical protein